MNVPSAPNFTTRLFVASPWPSATKMSPFGATTTSLGALKCVSVVAGDAGRAEPQQHLAARAELDDLMAAAVAVRPARALVGRRVGDPDVALRVDLEPVRPDEHAAAEARDRVAVRRELHDDVEIGLEAFVTELVAAGVAAQHGPDVPAVDVDVDVADGADLAGRPAASPSRRRGGTDSAMLAPSRRGPRRVGRRPRLRPARYVDRYAFLFSRESAARCAPARGALRLPCGTSAHRCSRR